MDLEGQKPGAELRLQDSDVNVRNHETAAIEGASNTNQNWDYTNVKTTSFRNTLAGFNPRPTTAPKVVDFVVKSEKLSRGSSSSSQKNQGIVKQPKPLFGKIKGMVNDTPAENNADVGEEVKVDPFR